MWFNGTMPFAVGGTSGYDIYSVVLHEAGHVFGIAENDDPTSAMYDHAVTRSGLNAADVNALTALYGSRSPDAFDAKSSNDTLKTATPLQVGSGPGSSATANVTADITTATDADVYVFQPSNLRGQGLTATVHVAGYSLLVPRLEILDASGRVIASGVGSKPGAGDVTLHLSGLTSGATYYARVSSGTFGVFGIGGYKLELRPDATSGGGSGGTQLLNPDAGSNDTIGTASQLGQQYLMTAGPQVEYSLSASLGTSTDVDFYRLKSPQTSNNAAVTMTATVWATQQGGTEPVVEVYDARGNRVVAEVLVNDGGAFTVQVANATANADYYVAVRHAHPGSGAAPRNYFLGVDFGGPVVNLTGYSAGTLSASVPVSQSSLKVSEAEVLHLVFDLTQATPSATAGARLTVIDSTGQVMASRFVLAGDAASLNVFLRPGEYRVIVGGGTTDGSTLPNLPFRLRGLIESDPIGPQPVDPTSQPSGSSPPPTPTPPPPVDWTGLGFYSPVTPVAPTTTAWWIAPPTDWTSTDLTVIAGLLTIVSGP